MNPCAPTFIPVEPSGDEFSSDEDGSSTPSSMEARHPDQDVRSPRARPRGRTIPSITIDPEGYESMFPALRTVNKVDPLKIRSPKMKRKQRSRRQISRGKDGRVQSSNSVNDEQLSIGHQFSQSSDDEEEGIALEPGQACGRLTPEREPGLLGGHGGPQLPIQTVDREAPDYDVHLRQTRELCHRLGIQFLWFSQIPLTATFHQNLPIQ
ncbi:hypothetical protein NW761_002237 [Fusarium oxysporum]|nr:hypothetical protein NW758_000733 [Fusarium oxysporum]KAJ4103444.1 hypothetical protein NW761_002237 [Fusarium oxysporum]KAJ4111972.1 hypothetical protein NW769_006695 [Fusarium oxysporum]